MLVGNWNIMDIAKSVTLSVHERYFYGNSEAFGNFQHKESPLENVTISYFRVMLDDKR